MENTFTKITTSCIIQEVNMMQHLEWSETDRLERVEALKKAQTICQSVLADILEDDYDSRSYWKSKKSTVEKYLEICQLSKYIESKVAINVQVEENIAAPYVVPEDDIERNSKIVVTMMILFWVLFFMACLIQ